MLFYSASAVALIFTALGMLIYRLGVSDGMKLRKNGACDGLFSKKREKKDTVEDWQSIINYDHRKQN